MGCDIHLHTEIKVDGQWEHHSIPKIGRDYRLFQKMAGICGNEISPIVQPKGLPSSPAKVTRIAHSFWHGLAHTASWFNQDEICELQFWLETSSSRVIHWLDREYSGYVFLGNPWTSKCPFPAGDYTIEDVRFVFWFDGQERIKEPAGL